MTTHRVQAPVIGEGEKVTGPASYFPQVIERTYDRPGAGLARHGYDALETRTHMEVVGMLKQEHGLGHGHANAVVAYVRAAQDG